tara:strand:+ start:1276 stop:2124 length:849 start_codon:yes stop_codon:yes gene_type:complete
MAVIKRDKCTESFIVRLASLAIILIPLKGIGATNVPHTFSTGAPAKASEVNENFSDLNSKIEALSNPGNSYSVVSTETLASGLIRTKIYAYEVGEYSAMRHVYTEANLFLSDGTEYVVNALGKFHVEYKFFADYGATYSDDNDSDFSPIACQDGSAMMRIDEDIFYNAYWRNEGKGTFVFSNRGTVNAGVYGGCNNFITDDGVTRQFGEYYYLEGKGVGIYSCVDRVAFYGAFFTPPTSYWDKVFVPASGINVTTGVFDRTTNGNWGTYYLEIDAPVGCLDI